MGVRLCICVLGTVTILLQACAGDDRPTRPSGVNEQLPASLLGCESLEFTNEPELFGSLYQNGVRICSGEYTIRLAPDSTAKAGLYLFGFDSSMVFEPRFDIEFGWWDPKDNSENAPGGCSPPTGGLPSYRLTGAYSPESHGHSGVLGPPWIPANDGGGAGPANEGHCIRPGSYLFTATSGNDSVQFWADYLQAQPGVVVSNTDYGRTERIEVETISDAGQVHDLKVRVDFPLLAGNGSESPVLDVDTTRPAQLTSFANVLNPTGKASTLFRFSISGSTVTWNNGQNPDFEGGRALARLHWDTASGAPRTGFYDMDAYGGPLFPAGTLIRIHRFSNPATASRTYRVGLEIKRPDEKPAGPSVFRDIVITRTPTDLLPFKIVPSKSEIVPGDTFSLRVTVQNQAATLGADEPPNWHTRGYFSPNNALIDGSDSIIADHDEIRSLPQGSKLDLVIPVHVPANAATGARWVIVHVDTLSLTPRTETNETNNRLAKGITVSPSSVVACATFERDTVWRLSDQVFDASCSSSPLGTTREYGWRIGAGGTFGGYSQSVKFEHLGTSSLGAYQISLRAKKVGIPTPVDTLIDTLIVLSPRVTIGGPTTVTSTLPQTYSAAASPGGPLASFWYVRLPPDTSWTLISGPTPVTSIQYAWPPGCSTGYTAYLRADASTPTVLKRFRLTVAVQTTSSC